MGDQEEDFSSLPLPDRFVHKNWKVRKEGYEAAAKEFSLAASESDPVVSSYRTLAFGREWWVTRMSPHNKKAWERYALFSTLQALRVVHGEQHLSAIYGAVH
jgi:hypothetical protein